MKYTWMKRLKKAALWGFCVATIVTLSLAVMQLAAVADGILRWPIGLGALLAFPGALLASLAIGNPHGIPSWEAIVTLALPVNWVVYTIILFLILRRTGIEAPRTKQRSGERTPS
jgi:hypothetical protein